MRYVFWLGVLLGVCCVGAEGQQGVIGDVIAGKLVKPKVGQWAWYDVVDKASGQRYVLREAVVGEERVGGKAGYWVEFEIVPQIGYRSVYKMLLTGPANDPKCVHRLLMREGVEKASEIELPPAGSEAPTPEAGRERIGQEAVATLRGPVQADHFRLLGKEGKGAEVWTNDEVRPMGLVRMVSEEGELILRNYGEGGNDARSVIDDPAPAEGQGAGDPKIEVHVEKAGKGRSTGAEKGDAAVPGASKP